jgi:hypothetical protein
MIDGLTGFFDKIGIFNGDVCCGVESIRNVDPICFSAFDVDVNS